jgi:branched-chain amino acid transport system permease protein
VLGALIIEPAQQYFQAQVAAGYTFLIAYGALFLLVILFLPRGIIPTAAEQVTNWRARRRGRELGGGTPRAAEVVDAAKELA